jgi:hypothetical protein
MRLKSMKGGHFRLARYVPDGLKLFSLGRTVAIIDNAAVSQKPPFFGQK